MATEVLSNNVATTLNGGINSSVTTITVASTAGMPATGQFRIVVETALGAGTGEIMLCTGIAGSVLTVVRNAEVNNGAASNPQAFLTGASVSLQLTAGAIVAYVLQQTIGFNSLLPAAEIASFTAVNQRLYQITVTSAAIVPTLPSPATAGQVIGFQTLPGITTGSVTITTPSGAIVGPGVVSGATTIKLMGVDGSMVVLESDGTNWNIIAGEQDTGWLPIPTYTNNWVSNGGPATGNTVAGYRLIGNLIMLGGSIKTGLTTAAAFTMPVGARPTRACSFVTVTTATPTLCYMALTTTGVMTPTFAAGTVPTLDGIEWTVD